MGFLNTTFPYTSKTWPAFEAAIKDGSMASLSTALAVQFLAKIKKCSEATQVSPLHHAGLIYIEAQPNGRSAWLENRFRGGGFGGSNSAFIGVSQIDVSTAAWTLFKSMNDRKLNEGELSIMQEVMGLAEFSILHGKLKNAAKNAAGGSGSDWLAKNQGERIERLLYEDTTFNILLGQMYFGLCLEKHAVGGRIDKAVYAYNRGYNSKTPLSINADLLLKSAGLDQVGKDYIVKYGGATTPLQYLKQYFPEKP